MMVASVKALFNAWMPAMPELDTDRGGVAEWLVVAVALIVLVVGILLTDAQEIIVEAAREAWDIVTGAE